MEALSALALLLKGIVKTDLKSATPLKIPSLFQATVKEVDGNNILLAWKNETIKAKLETTAKKGETLILQFKGEKDGQHFYRVLARSAEGAQDNCTGWHVLLSPEEEMRPAFLTVKHYRNNSGGAAKNAYLDIIFPTDSFGFVGIRILSYQKPYPCCFLVEKEEYGKILYDSASLWFADLDPDDFPITLRQFQVMDRKELVRDSSLFNQRA